MEEQKFSTVIVPKTGWFDLKLKEVLTKRKFSNDKAVRLDNVGWNGV